MPIYVFECQDCKSLTDVLLGSYKDLENKKFQCNKCESENVVRLIGSTSFALKGSGWAADNYQKIQRVSSKDTE